MAFSTVFQVEVLVHDIYSLMADIGGILGLLLGYSLFSVLDAGLDSLGEKRVQMPFAPAGRGRTREEEERRRRRNEVAGSREVS